MDQTVFLALNVFKNWLEGRDMGMVTGCFLFGSVHTSLLQVSGLEGTACSKLDS